MGSNKKNIWRIYMKSTAVSGQSGQNPEILKASDVIAFVNNELSMLSDAKTTDQNRVAHIEGRKAAFQIIKNWLS
jgi:hypothetical protein